MECICPVLQVAADAQAEEEAAHSVAAVSQAVAVSQAAVEVAASVEVQDLQVAVQDLQADLVLREVHSAAVRDPVVVSVVPVREVSVVPVVLAVLLIMVLITDLLIIITTDPSSAVFSPDVGADLMQVTADLVAVAV